MIKQSFVVFALREKCTARYPTGCNRCAMYVCVYARKVKRKNILVREMRVGKLIARKKKFAFKKEFKEILWRW